MPPLTIRAVGKPQYYQVGLPSLLAAALLLSSRVSQHRKPFTVMSLLANPTMIMMAVIGGLALCMPAMMKNMGE